MKTAFALSIFSFTFGLQALAANPQPWMSMLGRYSIPETCTIDSKTGFNKVEITLLRDGHRLSLKAYKGSQTGTQAVPIANFSDAYNGADGEVFYAVQKADETSFVSTEHFVRKGSDTWPDLEMLEAYSMSLENGVLVYKQSHQDTYTKGTKVETCVMTPMKASQDVQSEKITKFTDKDLAKFVKSANATLYKAGDRMDLDQAAFQLASFKVNKTNLTHDQLVEVLNLQVEFENVDITTTTVTNEIPQELAEKPFESVFGVIDETELNSPEYAPLQKLKKEVAAFLSLNKENLKVILIEWEHSDADGKGLLIMDQSTGESFYFGSGYFS